MPAAPVTPTVRGVHLVAYQGRSLDLQAVGRRVGGWNAPSAVGSPPSHDVFDVPIQAFHPFVRDNVPDTIASDPGLTTLRLYVPTGNRGQITDIGVMNGAYRSLGHPLVPRQGPIYTAPADAEKYRAVAPAREGFRHQGHGYREAANAWTPGDGDRFLVTEIP